MVRKIRKKLTKEQKARGIIFSSTLSTQREEMQGDTIHEVKFDTEDKEERIRRLLDDRFFNDSPFKFNIIRR